MRDAFHLTRPGGRSRTRGTASPRLAGTGRPLDRTLAVIVRRRRRGPEGPARRGAARGDRRRRGVRRRRPAGAVRRGASLCPRAARPDAGRRAPVAWRPGRGGRTARGLARRRRAGAAAQMAVRAALARRGAVLGRRTARRRRDAADGAEGAIVFAYAKGAARRLRSLGGARAAGAKAAGGPAEIARQGGSGRAARRCSTRIPSAHPPKSAGKYRSAARGGCSTGWSRSARSAN